MSASISEIGQGGLVLIGAGSHLPVAVEVGKLCAIAMEGIIDPAACPGTTLAGITILGGDEYIKMAIDRQCALHIAITDPAIRHKLRLQIEDLGGRLMSLIHPRAIVSTDASIGEGTFIAAGAIVNVGSKIGRNVCINTGAQIDHDSRIGEDSHIAPGAILAGNVICGERVFIASGAVIAPNLTVGARSIVGAGSTVLNSIRDDVFVVGAPACESTKGHPAKR